MLFDCLEPITYSYLTLHLAPYRTKNALRVTRMRYGWQGRLMVAVYQTAFSSNPTGVDRFPFHKLV